MAHEPTEDTQVFLRLATAALSCLEFGLETELSDLRADRGPYAVTSGVFYRNFLHLYKKSATFALAKLHFGTSDPVAGRFCGQVEAIFKQFDRVVLGPLYELSIDRASLLRALILETEASTSLATKCGSKLAEMMAYHAEVKELLEASDRVSRTGGSGGSEVLTASASPTDVPGGDPKEVLGANSEPNGQTSHADQPPVNPEDGPKESPNTL